MFFSFFLISFSPSILISLSLSPSMSFSPSIQVFISPLLCPSLLVSHLFLSLHSKSYSLPFYVRLSLFPFSFFLPLSYIYVFFFLLSIHIYLRGSHLPSGENPCLSSLSFPPF
uniref:Uncharacterized protein n=1 Tax=Cacopsylla melanoneura TaxID=428564 RepID=A0A8D9ERZ9_9HEMI